MKKNAHYAQCDKSRSLIKFLKEIFGIDSFEQKINIKVLQSKQTKQYMVSIGVYKSFINSALYGHRCLKNTKNLYKTAGKCDDQNQYKTIIEAAMVSTPEGCTNYSPMTPNPSVCTENTSERK